MTGGPLEGVRVVDASAGAVGPWAGSLLAQLGARVIKLESPQGDFIRNILPTQNGLATTYLSMNYGKLGLEVDMKSEAGKRAAHDLIAGGDVFIENFRPGVTERIGLGWAELSALNPRLVYASASGFGWSGPMVKIGATDPHIQAFSGSTSVNGRPGGPRQRVRWYGHFDVNTSLCIVQGVLAGLLERQRTGKGRLVRVTMVEAAMALQRVRIGEHLSGGAPRPMGTGITYLAPDRAYATLDSDIVVSATSQAQWRRLCEALGRAELADDPRFADNPARVENREALDSALAEVFATRSSGHWLRELAKARVPCAKPTCFDDFKHHVHYRDAGLVGPMETAHWGTLMAPGTPWQFARRPVSVAPPPAPGEHTEEILEHGWDSTGRSARAAQ
ncbi:carnitine dehydratase [Rhodobacteraceae bacterium WD3A24]|nr:carnitine dehydratase [Rhodobacteraceae bacterium WD3A24]